MSYNADTTIPSLVHLLGYAMTTPEQNAQQIAANTDAIAGLNNAVNFLVTDFIRPNAQQQQQSLERLERVEGIVEAIAQRLEETITQQQANAQQIAQNAAGITQYRQLLEETRQLVAQNASNVAQGSARHDQEMSEIRAAQDRNGQQIERLGTAQDRNGQQIERISVAQARNDEQIERLSTEVQAIAEASRTQLAAIIGNGRRIDRLEQQAS
ncbi:MAG: hypothetical protein AAFN12_02335 [Cyanobacteria bacterium J06560_2]